ncbi:glomulin [Petromyzon marinus]|uniref:Glomulin isoform X1 n=1 Tax=Petromyzon marinus TaxID=7757 RepID=A0AAJ7U785_PETMA|nr:glomulin isoform X1 [Petromyzon marinus]XP_032829562.1 glomulin isoform X2 [Petromyzon marinus]
MEAESASEAATTADEQLHHALTLSDGIPEDEVTPAASEGFVGAAGHCLTEGKVALVLDALRDPRYTGVVRSAAWSLVSPLVEQLSREAATSDGHEACEACLRAVVQECSPRELMLGLLEALEASPVESSARTTLLLLPHVNTVVSRLRTGRAYSLGLFLSGAVSATKALPLPHTAQQRRADAHSLLRAHAALADAVRPYVMRAGGSPAGRDAPPGAAGGAEREELRQELLRYCACVLEYPLLPAVMDALPEEEDEAEEFPLCGTAQALLGHMTVLGVSPSGLVMAGEGTRRGGGHSVGVVGGEMEEGDRRFSSDALCCLAHLLLVQRLHVFPAVYSSEFLLQRTLCYVSAMLQTNEEAVTLKGMALLEWALGQAAPRALGRPLLELPVFLQLPQNLIKVMTLCPAEQLRRRSLSLFQSYLDRFEPAAMHTLYRVLFRTSSHAGVAGFLIHAVKTQVDLALKGSTDGDRACFLGPSLVPLLHSALSLEHGAETDLLQGSDRVMAGLNLLRYLVIRDPPWENRTCVWTELSRLEERFLRPLRTGLSLSRAHYDNELTRSRSGDTQRDSVTDGAGLSVSVGGDPLPSMPLKQRAQVLQSALFTFDLMESVMVRLEELIEAEQKPPLCVTGHPLETLAGLPLEAPATP